MNILNVFSKLNKRRKCKHHFQPTYMVFMSGGTDRLNVSECKCGKIKYRSKHSLFSLGTKY